MQIRFVLFTIILLFFLQYVKANSIDRFANTIENMQIKEPITPKQRRYNAAMGGFAAGLHMSQDRKRNQNLEELEGNLEDLTMLNIKLETLRLKNEIQQIDYTNYATKNFDSLLQFDKTYNRCSKTLGDIIFNSLKKISPILANQDIFFSHIYNKRVYFKNNNGAYKSYDIKNLLSPVIYTLPQQKRKKFNNIIY